jgi:hypothetical protein
MRANTRPCVAVNVEKQCILRCPYEAIGDHVRMLGEEQRWYNRTGGEPFDVVAAHPVKERHPIITQHANELALEECAYPCTALKYVVVSEYLRTVRRSWGYGSGRFPGVLHGYRVLRQSCILLAERDARHPATGELGLRAVHGWQRSADGGQWDMIQMEGAKHPWARSCWD